MATSIDDRLDTIPRKKPLRQRRIVRVELPEDLAVWLTRHLEQSPEPEAARISTRTAARLRETQQPRKTIDGDGRRVTR